MKRLRWQTVFTTLGAMVALYWAIGVSVGPGLVRSQLLELLAGASDQTLKVDSLSFNPFTMAASFENLRLSELDGSSVLTVNAGHLHLALAGIIGEAVAFSDLLLDQPSLVIAASGPTGDRSLRSWGGLFFSSRNDGTRKPIRIAHAKIVGGEVTILEKNPSGSKPTPTGTYISELNIELTDWASDAAEPSVFHLAAKVDESGTVGIRGVWTPATQAFDARIELTDLLLAPLIKLSDTLHVDAQLAGVLSAQGQFRYRVDTAEFNGDLIVERLSLDDFGGQPLLSADRLTAHGVKIGGERSPASVQWIELDRPELVLHLDKNNQLNVHSLNMNRLVRVDKLTVHNGSARFTDANHLAVSQINTGKIAGTITRSTEGLKESVTINLTGEVFEQGAAMIGGVFSSDGDSVQAEGEIKLNGIDVSLMSPYFSNLTARELNSGTLDLDLLYYKDGPKLSLTSKLRLANLKVSAPAEEAPTVYLPLDLTIALLTDEHHRMTFELPVNFSSIDSSDALRQGFENALTDFVRSTTAEPMRMIARLAGLEPTRVDRIDFAAGSTNILPTSERQLAAWVDALTQRPLLSVRAQGQFAERKDRAALARRQIGQHVSLAASTRAGTFSAPTELDFSDANVQAVLDEFAAARLNKDEQTNLKAGAAEHGEAASNVTHEPNNKTNYPAVFEALAAKESVSDYALRQLARYRARSVVDRLQELGIETQRLEVDKQTAAVESDDAPARVALTILAPSRTGN